MLELEPMFWKHHDFVDKMSDLDTCQPSLIVSVAIPGNDHAQISCAIDLLTGLCPHGMW